MVKSPLRPIESCGPHPRRRDMADPVGYKRAAPGTQPDYLHAAYQSTVKRSPSKPLVVLPHTLTEITGPLLGHDQVGATDADLTKQHKGEPIGERIIVGGAILDED